MKTRLVWPLCMLVAAGGFVTFEAAAPPDPLPVRIVATRSADGPIIMPDMLPGADGASINGPGIMRVPAWVANPKGRYYLYFAHHQGKYLRMAYADRVEGPWKIYDGGVLSLDRQQVVAGHVASPDPIVDEQEHRIVLFYHGGPKKKAGEDSESGQITSVATSTDGLHFKPIDVVIGPAYQRIFRRNGDWFAINGHGDLLRSKFIDRPFEPVAQIIGPEIAALVDPVKLGEPGARSDRPATGADRYSIRHVGIDIRGNLLLIYFSCVGHRPERLLATAIDMTGEPATWRAKGVQEVLHPESKLEGTDVPLAYSKGGISKVREQALRDPAVFKDGDRTWLIYTIAGEHGLGLARIEYQTLATK